MHVAARRTAAALVEGGLSAGEAVAVLAGDPGQVAQVAQGIWLAGGSVTMLHQPTPRTDLTVWRDDTLRVLRMIDARLVVVGAPFEAMADVLRDQGIAHRMIADLDSDREFSVVPAAEDDTALLQLTSGSTAEPKAVRITTPATCTPTWSTVWPTWSAASPTRWSAGCRSSTTWAWSAAC
ncbi:hypothetical protein GCM10017556_00030 [Micromonospora sagamiensis]|nr:AMP-binding protein [Micromonospora sagamiensis]BCL12264.1 hypothetical protein GCM10017556_00030 [Micromonospora sagamiensis]